MQYHYKTTGIDAVVCNFLPSISAHIHLLYHSLHTGCTHLEFGVHTYGGNCKATVQQLASSGPPEEFLREQYVPPSSRCRSMGTRSRTDDRQGIGPQVSQPARREVVFRHRRSQPSSPSHSASGPCSRSSRLSNTPPPSGIDVHPHVPEPSGPRGHGLHVKTSSLSCSSWLHFLKSWSLRQSRGGSTCWRNQPEPCNRL